MSLLDEERRKIIINEIKYWKENKLLPEHYCHFLLMIYTEGEEIRGEQKPSRDIWAQFSKMVAILIGFLALFFTFIVIHFTSFSLLLQMVVYLSIVSTVIGTMLFIRNKDRMIFHILLSIVALILLTTSAHVVHHLFASNIAVLVTVIIHCLLWLFNGFYFQLAYLKWAGGIGFLIILLFHLF